MMNTSMLDLAMLVYEDLGKKWEEGLRRKGRDWSRGGKGGGHNGWE